jgi:hypothetical protein
MSLVRAFALTVLAYLAAVCHASEVFANDSKDQIPAKLEALAATFPVGRYKVRTYKADANGAVQGVATRDTNVCVRAPAELKSMMGAGIVTTAISADQRRRFGLVCQDAVKVGENTVVLESVCEPPKPQKGKSGRDAKETKDARMSGPNHFSSRMGVVRGKEFQILSREYQTNGTTSNFVDGTMTQVFPLSSECIASDETTPAVAH